MSLIRNKNYYMQFNRLDKLNSKDNLILQYYKRNMLIVMSRLFKNKSKDQLEQDIDDIIKNRFHERSIKLIYHDRASNDYRIEQKDLSLVTDYIKNNLVHTPTGSSYIPSKVEESIHSAFISHNQKQRSKIKKQMLQAEAQHQDNLYDSLNTEQMNIKILINAISGVMLLPSTFFSSKWNYNAITSIVRYVIMSGYGIIERFLSGFLFFENINDVINYITLLIESYPGNKKIKSILNKYKLYQPTKKDLYDYLMNNYSYYTLTIPSSEQELVNKCLESLSSYERSYIYYCGSLYNLMFNNVPLFKQWIDEFFTQRDILIQKYLTKDSIQVKSVSESFLDLPDHILTVSLNLDIVQKQLKSDKETLQDVLANNNIHQFFIEYHHFVIKHIESMFKPIFDTFFNDTLLPNVLKHKNMIRKSVLISDTDSIIFTLESFISKFNNDKLVVNNRTRCINMIIVYLISSYLAHVFMYISANLNIEKEHLTDINIKSEFFYPVLIITMLRKHYTGIIQVREGTFLNPPKLDLKGQIFKKSNLSFSLRDRFKSWVYNDILIPIMNGNQLSLKEIIKQIIGLDIDIINSINDNKDTYLTSIPIKNKTDYKNPKISIYFYYQFYKSIYKSIFGNNIQLPHKFVKIPLKYGITYKKINLINKIKLSNPKLFMKIVKFLKKYPSKTIRFLYLPLEKPEIPSELMYLIDYPKIIRNNCLGYHVLLASLGFILPDSSNNICTLLDLYPEYANNLR